MNKINLIRELDKYQVFNLKRIKDIIGKNNDYVKLVIYRLKKQILIFKIEKNKYTTQRNTWVIASSIIWPSYISCWSALRYYNLTEQLPETFFVISPKQRKKRILEINNSKIVFIKTTFKSFFGYKKEIYNGFEIFIADKEKAIIDSALFKKISFSEISEIMRNNKEEINFNLFLDYLIRIKNKALIKRFGFLLDKLKLDTKKLEEFIDFKYVPLEYSIKFRGKIKNKKWRIIENVEL